MKASKDYLQMSVSLRSEAARNRDTIAYLEAISTIQEKTAEYIEKQFRRGELDLCEGAIQGLLGLDGRSIADLQALAFGKGRYGKVGGLSE
jgi:hypothetical protein